MAGTRPPATPAAQIALLRGINVGTAKRIAMADLRALVESLGYGHVRTLLNSGNVVFRARAGSSDEAAARIERAIAKRLGVDARVTVLSAAELDVAIAGNPLLGVAKNPSRLLVAVPAKPAELARLKPLARQDWSPGALALGQRVAYLWCPNGLMDSPLSKAVWRALGDLVTSRNWATILKLQALARE